MFKLIFLPFLFPLLGFCIGAGFGGASQPLSEVAPRRIRHLMLGIAIACAPVAVVLVLALFLPLDQWGFVATLAAATGVAALFGFFIGFAVGVLCSSRRNRKLELHSPKQ